MVIGDDNRIGRFIPANTLYFRSICLFVISLYGPFIKFNNVAIICMGLAWIYAGNYRHLKRLLMNKAAMALLLWYLYQVCTLVYSTNRSNGLKWTEYRSPLIYLPFFLGTSLLLKSEIKKILLLFAWTTAAAALLGLGYGVFQTLNTGDTGYLYNDSLGILFEKQAVYFAMYVNFAVVILLWNLQQGYFGKTRIRNLAVCTVIFLVAFVYLLACRTALLLLLVVIAGQLVYMIYSRKQYLTGAILALGLVLAGSFFYKLFPKASSRLLFVTQMNYNYESKGPADHFNGAHTSDNWNSVNTRLAIWSCSKEVIREHWLVGTGIGDSEDALIKEYEQRHFDFAIQYRLNSHNQYLDALLSFGVIGFVLFVGAVFFFPFREAWRRKDKVFLFFMCSLTIYLITEVMFSRNQGLAFIGFFIPLMSSPPQREEEA